jgi:quinol monooxygenase YgiN
MIIEWVGIVVSPERRVDLGRALRSLVGPTQVEPGCLSCLTYQDAEDADVLYLESRWATITDLIRHVQSDRYKRLLGLMELGIEPPTIEFLTVNEVRGLDLIKAARGDSVTGFRLTPAEDG